MNFSIYIAKYPFRYFIVYCLLFSVRNFVFIIEITKAVKMTSYIIFDNNFIGLLLFEELE